MLLAVLLAVLAMLAMLAVLAVLPMLWRAHHALHGPPHHATRLHPWADRPLWHVLHTWVGCHGPGAALAHHVHERARHGHEALRPAGGHATSLHGCCWDYTRCGRGGGSEAC